MRTERGYKEKTLDNIMVKICALLNSGGGKLILVNESNHHHSTQQRIKDACVRMIEQKILEFTNLCILAAKISVSYSHSQIVFDIGHDEKQPYTLNYNLYLPSQTQVLAVQGSEMLEKVTEVVQGENVVEQVVQLGSHQKKFVHFEHVQVQQSNVVQFKNLKAKASKCVRLSDRIIGNKFSCYISAFANHRGGHIYYGINDEGAVEGEKIADESQDEVTRKVKKTIAKMVFPKNGCNRPGKGKDWEIFFVPVENTAGDPIHLTFVIVIYVAHCPGGVFTEEPESYHIVESQVIKMSFDIWLSILKKTPAPLQTPSIPRLVPRTSWSSNRSEMFFQKLTSRLMKLRNQGDTKGFRDLSNLAKERFPESDASLIVEAEETVIACKQNCLAKATELQQKFANLLTSTKDTLIHEVRNLHLQSMIKRGAGEYEESYKLAQDGLQKMQLISPGFTTVLFYIHAAMAAILHHANKKQDLHKSCTPKEEALRHLDLAERVAHSLEDSLDELSDLQQKLHIYKAIVSLDCSITGETVQQQHKMTDTAQAATKELGFVYETALMVNPLTPYREVQYLLSQSDLLYRRTEGFREENATQNVKRAFEFVEESLRLAKKWDFQDMIQYASKRRANLTEKLICNAFIASKTKGKSLSHSLGFLDLI